VVPIWEEKKIIQLILSKARNIIGIQRKQLHSVPTQANAYLQPPANPNFPSDHLCEPAPHFKGLPCTVLPAAKVLA
jgi:hypothetical protein